MFHVRSGNPSKLALDFTLGTDVIDGIVSGCWWTFFALCINLLNPRQYVNTAIRSTTAQRYHRTLLPNFIAILMQWCFPFLSASWEEVIAQNLNTFPATVDVRRQPLVGSEVQPQSISFSTGRTSSTKITCNCQSLLSPSCTKVMDTFWRGKTRSSGLQSAQSRDLPWRIFSLNLSPSPSSHCCME